MCLITGLGLVEKCRLLKLDGAMHHDWPFRRAVLLLRFSVCKHVGSIHHVTEFHPFVASSESCRAVVLPFLLCGSQLGRQVRAV